MGWDPGAKAAATSEGQQNGWRLRGSDNVSYHIADIMRCVDAGFRGFLVYDEGILLILNEMRAKGLLPPETFFKFSVFGGYASAAGAKVISGMGINSFNPAPDLTLPILAGIRKVLDIPMERLHNRAGFLRRDVPGLRGSRNRPRGRAGVLQI